MKNHDLERRVELVENNNNNNNNHNNLEHIALVVVSPPGEHDKFSQWREREEQEFMAIMSRHIFRGNEDRRRFEECSIRTMNDLRMLQRSDLILLFPSTQDFMIRRRLSYIMEYLQKHPTTNQRNQSLQLQNMTMQMIIDSLCQQRHWCLILLDSPMILFSLIWLMIICITGYFLTRGQ